MEMNLQFFGGRGSSGGKRSGGGGGTGSDKGELARTYSDGTKVYEKENSQLSESEQKKEYTMMDSAIIADFVDQYNAEASSSRRITSRDVEFNRTTGDITVWTGNDPSRTGNWDTGVKRFYSTSIFGTKVTTVRPNGKEDTPYYKDLTYRFTYKGNKN